MRTHPRPLLRQPLLLFSRRDQALRRRQRGAIGVLSTRTRVVTLVFYEHFDVDGCTMGEVGLRLLKLMLSGESPVPVLARTVLDAGARVPRAVKQAIVAPLSLPHFEGDWGGPSELRPNRD